MHGGARSGGHVENDVCIMLVDTLDGDLDGTVGFLVEVEVGVNTVGEGLEVTATRNIRTKDNGASDERE